MSYVAKAPTFDFIQWTGSNEQDILDWLFSKGQHGYSGWHSIGSPTTFGLLNQTTGGSYFQQLSWSVGSWIGINPVSAGLSDQLLVVADDNGVPLGYEVA